MAVTLTTTDEIDISRGDMIVHTDSLPRVSNSLKVMLVWMDEDPMVPGKSYVIKRATTEVTGFIERINYRVDINTYKREEAKELSLNDIASCKMVLTQPIAVDAYKKNRATGAFIVIDPLTNNTVGAGMIVNVSRRENEGKELPPSRVYTEAEKELNAYIRRFYPEWGCRKI